MTSTTHQRLRLGSGRLCAPRQGAPWPTLGVSTPGRAGRPSPRHSFALALLALLAPLAQAQQQGPTPDGEPLEVERVFVPEQGFDRVVKRYPRGVIVAESELAELLRRAGLKPAPAATAPTSPVPFAIRATRVTGAVTGDVAEVACEADVAVLSPGQVAVPLPLAGAGVRAVTVDGQPARLIGGGSPRVLLEGPSAEQAQAGLSASRTVAWTLALRVAQGEERGAGVISLRVPVSAAGQLTLDVPGDVEAVGPSVAPPAGAPAQQQRPMSRAMNRQAEEPEAASSIVAWSEARGDATRIHAAFGGTLQDGGSELSLAWRPRRAQGQLTPYVIADDRSLFLVRPGVVALESVVLLEVYRAGRDRFSMDLPAGFVVRSLQVPGEEVTYVQRGDRVEVVLSGPRTGRLEARLRAELTIGDLTSAEAGVKVGLRPLGFPDVDRASGLVGVAQGEGAVVTFEKDGGLERADLVELELAGNLTKGQTGPAQGERQLRVYRRGQSAPPLDLVARPLAPKVDLDVLAAVQLKEREQRLVAAYRFRVEEGRVFSVRAALDAGWTIETAIVRDGAGNEPAHELRQTDTSVTVELPSGLSPGQELLVTLQAACDAPDGLGKRVAIPRLVGSPATRTHGHLGFQPDEAFRATGADLAALTPIPAEELPRVGLSVAGLLLGYRIEGPEYQGALVLTPRETRVSSQVTAYHRVAERVVETDAALALVVDGAPVTKLELLLPKGVGRAARIEGVELADERELVGEETLPGGGVRERWRLTLDPRRGGQFTLRVKFTTTLAGDEKEGVTEAALPQVSLAGAFRERGTIAVYSSDATELTARPKGLRTIEVTDVPALAGSAFEGRPLVAYTFVGPYDLGVSIRRHGAAPTLAAVVEQLALASTVSADGTARHVATFTVRHLRSQFFALKLPPDALLWSVVVDGKGVKPARKDGLELVPMPEEATGEGDTIVVTYTLKRDAWGLLGRTAQEAPELRVSSDVAVPVLRTSWALSVPDDYRVLELSGNVAGGEGVQRTRPIVLTAWAALTHEGGLPYLGLLALCLAIAASPRARGGLLVGVAGLARATGKGRHATRAAVSGATGALRSKIVWLVVGLLLVGFCVLSMATRTMRRALDGAYGGAVSAMPAPAGRAHYEAAEEQERLRTTNTAETLYREGDKDSNEGLDYGDMAKAAAPMDGVPAPAAPPPPPVLAQPTPDVADGPMPVESAPAPKPQAPAGRPRPNRRARQAPGAGEAAGAPTTPAAPPSEPEGTETEDMDFAPAKEEESASRLGLDDDLDGREMKGDAMGVGGGGPEEAQKRKVRDALAANTGTRGQEAPAGNKKDLSGRPDEAQQELPKTAERGETLEKKPAEKVLDATVEATGAQVGLRSLILSLPPLGQQARFYRPGGGASLQADVVREDALNVGAGLLAALGLILGLGLPRWTKLGYLGVLLVALAAVTAGPQLAAATRYTPLWNALALGLVAAAPFHLGLALARGWDRRPFARLGAEIKRVNAPAPAGASRVAVALLVGGLLLSGAGEARADEPAPPATPRVYVPYDPQNPDAPTGRVFVPEDLYQQLWRRAYPDKVPVARPLPLAPTVVTQVEYDGALVGEKLTLTAKVLVDVLADGWQRATLGLAGTGLQASKVVRTAGTPSTGVGGATGADQPRVIVSPSGFELSAPGPASYQVTLELVVPARDGSWFFATVPAVAAQLRVKATLGDRRLDVGGARAQVERQLAGGESLTDASLGDAPRVQLALAGREVLSAGGASEASGTTQSVVWVRRGRVVVASSTQFTISGTGREGFLFSVPAGLAVTSVQTDSLRAWRLDEQGRLEVALRRPTGQRHTVSITGELLLPDGATRVRAPHLVAQGVSRDSGTIGLCVEPGLRVRPVDPPAALRQVDTRSVAGLATALRAPAVERAYEFARRPAELDLELVSEPVEVKADTDVQAVVLADRTLVRAQVAWDVRRGKVYELAVRVPVDYELVSAGGMDLRETSSVILPGEEARTLRFGLAAGLSGPGRLDLVLERRALVKDGQSVPFPDVRPIGAAFETTTVTVGAGSGLKLRAQDPAGFQSRDARATRAAPMVEGAEWLLAWQRPAARGTGLASAPLTVQRPTARVEGSWVLHAMLERDVVRYTLRALATIQGAGATSFHALVPASVADRVSVEAPNLREMRVEKVDEATSRVTVELQSPAEGFYDYALVWEELLPAADVEWKLPTVGLDKLDRQVRGFVLVEKAADVADLLELVGVSGAIAEGRASDAPALPPGRNASSFGRFAYRVETKAGEGWTATLKLRPREVRLPPAARIPWAQLTSVFTPDGVVRHRAVYRVRNLRLQFLALKLPPGAEVWSAFVAGAPKRIHADGERTLVPLPKRTDADLSFDVELVYATPLAQAFGFGTRVDVQGPVVDTPEVKVERTSWTLHVPEGYDVSGLEGSLKPATAATSQVQALVEEVNELKKLSELASQSGGTTREVAGRNIEAQKQRAYKQLQTLEALGTASGEDQKLLASNRMELTSVDRAVEERKAKESADREKQEAERSGQQAEVNVDGNAFQRAQSGWYTNEQVVGKDNQTQWAGLPSNAPASTTTTLGQGQPNAQDRWTLAVGEGQSLELKNAEVFQGEQVDTKTPRQQQYGQQQQVQLRGKRMLGNDNYNEGETDGGMTQVDPPSLQLAQDPSSLPEVGASAAGEGGRRFHGGYLSAGGLVEQTRATSDATAGLMSIAVSFETPGVPVHLATDGQEVPRVGFKVYPQGAGESAARLGRGVVLLILLAGLFRLGLLTPLPGRAALQTLLLLGAAALAAGIFVHPAGLIAALAAGLAALRKGPLLAA